MEQVMGRKGGVRQLRPMVAITALLFLACASSAGGDQNAPLPQGAAIPAISGPSANAGGGRGFVEAGGGTSTPIQDIPSWSNAYIRAQLSGERNTVQTEVTRQNFFYNHGWYLSGGLTHTFTENWYGDVHLGGGSRTFFLPKYRTDAFIHRKLLPDRRLVTTLGFGYDRAKDIHSAYRVYTEGSYYLRPAWMLQGGLTWHSVMPGAVFGHTQYLGITEGQAKRHYITIRGEYGRDAYQPLPQTVLINYPLRDISVNWRQWLAPNWGFNVTMEHRDCNGCYGNPFYHRVPVTAGAFLDF